MKYLRNYLVLTLLCAGMVMFYSCSEDIIPENEKNASLTEKQLDQNIMKISVVLANAVHNNNELVKEIEKEISYRFDYDNDALIKTFLGREIGGEKFEDILSKSSNGKYSSKDIEKMILESGYLQFTFPQNYKDLDYESTTPLAVPVYSFINEQDSEYLESFDKDGTIHKLCAKEMPNVPVIVVGPSERVDEDGYMRVSERSVVLPKQMRNLHYTEAIEEARNPLKSAKTDNHIVKILSQEEFDKLGEGQEPIVATQNEVLAEDFEANLKSLTIDDAQLSGFTNRPGEISLQWKRYSNGTYTSNRYALIRNGQAVVSNFQGLSYTDKVTPNNIYNYIIKYYYNDIYLNEESNVLSLHSSHRRSGGKEYIDRLYASHNMVVDLEGWWVSELEIKWDILIGNADGTVTEVAKSIDAKIDYSGGASWDTQKGDQIINARFVYDDKDVDLFRWYKAGNAGYTYTIRFLEDDGGTKEENVDVWVDVIALVAEAGLTAAGKLEVVALIEATKPKIKKIIKNLRKDDFIGQTIVNWADPQADKYNLNSKGCYINISQR